MQFANRHIGYHLQIQLVPRRASPNFSIWGDGQKMCVPPNSAASFRHWSRPWRRWHPRALSVVSTKRNARNQRNEREKVRKDRSGRCVRCVRCVGWKHCRVESGRLSSPACLGASRPRQHLIDHRLTLSLSGGPSCRRDGFNIDTDNDVHIYLHRPQPRSNGIWADGGPIRCTLQ